MKESAADAGSSASTAVTTSTPSTAFTLERNPLGQLVHVAPDGTRSVGIVPVRAFPIGAPDEGLSLVSTEGRELAWIERLADLPDALRSVLEQELASREFVPEIQRLRKVSTFSTPSIWSVDTDRGPADFVLKTEEDIRRLGPTRLLITGAQGVQFLVRDWARLDRNSRRLLERFL